MATDPASSPAKGRLIPPRDYRQPLGPPQCFFRGRAGRRGGPGRGSGAAGDGEKKRGGTARFRPSTLWPGRPRGPDSGLILGSGPFPSGPPYLLATPAAGKASLTWDSSPARTRTRSLALRVSPPWT